MVGGRPYKRFTCFGQEIEESFVLARLVIVHNLRLKLIMKSAFENLTPPLTKGRLRFSDDAGKTVKTVQVTLARWATPLKRGVNERKSAFVTPFVHLCRPIGSGLVLFVCFFVAVAMTNAASVFDDFVRVTEALTPEQELK